MSYGLKIFREDGSRFISPEGTPMNFIGVYRFTGNMTIPTDIPATANVISFIRNDSATGAAYVIPVASNGKWNLNLNCNGVGGHVYVFANVVPIAHGVGMAVYNSNGDMVWNTDCLPLELHFVDNPWNGSGNGNGANYDVNVGLPAAVVSGMSSNYLVPLDPAAGIYIYGTLTARAYGNIVGGYSIYSEQINGQAPTPRFKKQYIYIDTRLYS